MKIRAKILILILGLTTLSCDTWLEQLPPENLIREEFWQSKEDVEAVVMGAYETLANMSGNLFKYGELRADMITGGNNQSGTDRNIQQGSIYSDNGLCNWANFYKVINYCNEVISNAPGVQDIDNTFTNYQLKAYTAEALYIRSLAYFYLVRIFKDVPYITEPSETDDSEFYPRKMGGDTILAKVIVDLEAHRLEATSDGYKTIEDLKGRATQMAFDALLADINLWLFNYEEVLKYVQTIESNHEYKLSRTQEWYRLFNPGNQSESIFELQFDTERNQNNGLFGMMLEKNDNTYASISAIEILGRGFATEIIRGEGSTIKPYGNDTQYLIWKYIGSSSGSTSPVRAASIEGSANFIIYRLAEIVLMKAEALTFLNRYDEAIDEINIIRERAQVPPRNKVSLSEVVLEDYILEERAKELCFEGKRWFDLMRMGRRNDFKRKDKLINVILKNVPSTQKRILEVKLSNPLGWYLPIHEDELERNKQLVQNPYYDN